MKKLLLLLLLVPLLSFGQNYTIERNVDGSLTMYDNSNPLKGWTMRKQVDGSYQTTDNSNVLNSYTLRRQPSGNYEFTSDSNPLNSYSINKNVDNSYSTVNNRDIFDSKTTTQNVDGSYTTRNDFDFLDSSIATQNVDGTISVNKTPNYSKPNFVLSNSTYSNSNIQPVIIPKNNYSSTGAYANPNGYSSAGAYANPNGYSSAGAYENPKVIIDDRSGQIYSQAIQSFASSMSRIGSRMNAIVAAFNYPQVIPSKEIFNNYKYILFSVDESNYSRSARRVFQKKLTKEFVKGDVPLYINLEEPYKTHEKMPFDAIEDPSIVLVAAVNHAKGYGRLSKTNLAFFTLDENLIYSKTKKGASMTGPIGKLVKEIFSDYKFIKKYKVNSNLTPSKKEISNNKNLKKSELAGIGSEVIISKDDAKKQLLELKEYLDLGIITQEDFDKKAVSLKKILLGN